MNRMTWIKPSFNWMMYRCGYASKPGQEVVLGIDITRAGLEWALENAVLSAYDHNMHSSFETWRSSLSQAPVRVQWDPERDWRLQLTEGARAIQIGLSGEAVERYVSEWITKIEDVTPVARRIAIDAKGEGVPDQLPHELEKTYPMNPALEQKLSRTILPRSG